MKSKFLTEFLLCTLLVFPQSYLSDEGIPKDSSYTVYGYYQKELKNFPFIKIARKSIKSNVKEENNLVYKLIGKRNLKLDLFIPDSSEKPIPIVVFIHGGGWRSGNKSFQHPLANEIAAKGFLCASIEYRLSPEAKYPAAVLDIKSAIKWLKKNAERYNADSSKVTLLGCSSGGHLAALCGVTVNLSKFEPNEYLPKISSKVQKVIDLDGILDFTHPAESGKDTSELFPSVGKLWFGQTYKENPSLWIEASPLSYVSENSPEFFFINSASDRFHAGRDSAVVLFEKYKINFKIETLHYTPHTFWLFDPWFKPTVNFIVDFLKK
ncbi:MAG: alpha/beta hydrolase [Ignavibacteriales bacterium]|nr:alpha/beta hydrolase [Ignavibacteriales bacterium]